MKPIIIGLTLNYRDSTRTIKCVNSLISNGLTHVLVWDNSEDHGDSATNIKSYYLKESKVSIEISAKNIGFSSGVNRSLEWIKSHYPNAWVLLINNDATVENNTISKLTTALINNHKAIIAYPSINQKNPHDTVYYHKYLALSLKTKIPGAITYASGCCQLLATERLHKAWFDEDFFMYGEDVKQSYDLGEHSFVHIKDALVYHEGSASSKIGSLFYETHLVIAHWLLANKLTENRFKCISAYIGRIITLSLRAIVRTVRYRNLAPLKGFLEGSKIAVHKINFKNK